MCVQNNLERTEYETKDRLGRQVETLQAENTALRSKVLRAEAKEAHGISQSVAKLLEVS